MKNRFEIIMLPLLLLFALTNANAKWWIFGQNENSVDIAYLYVNSISFDSANKKILLSKDSLDNGLLHIKGKANAGSSHIGRVLVSIDGKKTWQKAKLTRDGAFDFTFEPELNKPYDVFVQVLDTTGKSNDIEDTHKTITVVDKNMRKIVEDTLNHLRIAYSNEDISGFMKYVSEDFTGDDTTLELALRKDFSAFDNIQIDFTISSMAYNDGKYLVGISFNRSLESSKDGKIYNDSGVTEFGFVDGKNGAMLYSMKNPLIFGLSDADEVADGSVVTETNKKIITVDSTGDVKKSSIADIVNKTDTVSGGIVNLNATGATDPNTGGLLYQGYIFSSESIVAYGAGDINPDLENGNSVYFTAGNGACIVDTYSGCTGGTIGLIGDSFEVHLSNGNIVIFKLTSANSSTITIDWNYE